MLTPFLSLTEVGEACLCGHMCYFIAIRYLFFHSSSSVDQHGDQLLTVIFRFLSARCVWWASLALIKFSCYRRHVAVLCMIKNVNSNLNHCLFGDLSSSSTKVQHSGAATSQFARSFYRSEFVCGITFHIMCLTPGLNGIKEAVNRWLILWVVFFQFSVAQVLVGLRIKIFNNVFFPLGPGLLVLIIIIIIILFYQYLLSLWACIVRRNTSPKTKELCATNELWYCKPHHKIKLI